MQQPDWFQGQSVLSDKLLQVGCRLSEVEEYVETELGADCLEAFRYAFDCMYRVQRSSGEAAICHTADVAVRAKDLGLPGIYIKLALLHDCVEDTSKSPEACVRNLQEIDRVFGHELGANVRLLTNRYALIVDRAVKSLDRGETTLEMTPESVAHVVSEVQRLRRTLRADVQKALEHEYDRLTESLPTMDLAEGLRIFRINRNYKLSTEIALYVYGLFVNDMVDDFKKRNPGRVYDVPLVVKFLDANDNLRTSAATERMKLEKVLRKTQTILDRSFHLHGYLHELGVEDRVFAVTYEYLKYSLVEQMIERRAALRNLGDTRFTPLSTFIVDQITSLENKYKIELDPPTHIASLREELRSLLQANHR